MILELDTDLFKIFGDISINQLVFLTLVMNDNQSNNQDIHEFLSRISEDDILELIQNGYIVVTTTDNEIIYSLTEEYKEKVKPEKTWFDYFYELYPVYVIRPDGTKGFLRANVNKCRKEYNKVVGKSKAMHQHICDCLTKEINYKMDTGNIGYMKTMWKWLTQKEWEAMEEANNIETVKDEEEYGNALI